MSSGSPREGHVYDGDRPLSYSHNDKAEVECEIRERRNVVCTEFNHLMTSTLVDMYDFNDWGP